MLPLWGLSKKTYNLLFVCSGISSDNIISAVVPGVDPAVRAGGAAGAAAVEGALGRGLPAPPARPARPARRAPAPHTLQTPRSTGQCHETTCCIV